MRSQRLTPARYNRRPSHATTAAAGCASMLLLRDRQANVAAPIKQEAKIGNRIADDCSWPLDDGGRLSPGREPAASLLHQNGSYSAVALQLLTFEGALRTGAIYHDRSVSIQANDFLRASIRIDLESAGPNV